MKPAHIREHRLKEIRRIHMRQQEIWAEQRALGYKKLERPIRHGWFKEIVITRRIERYRHCDSLLEVFAKLEKQFWGRTKEEADQKWRHSTAQYSIHRDLPTLSRKQYNQLSERAQALCVGFQFYTLKKKQRTRYYVNIPKGTYKIKFTRAYVTHTRRIDPVLERENARLAQLEYKKRVLRTLPEILPMEG